LIPTTKKIKWPAQNLFSETRGLGFRRFYVAEGLPYALVMSVSVVLYKNLGISNQDIRDLHELVISAVGHQAAVESVRGHFEKRGANGSGRCNF